MAGRIVHSTVNAAPVQTTDATVTTVHSWTPGSHSPVVNNCITYVEVTMIGKVSGGTGVTIKSGATFAVTSGTVSQLGSLTPILPAQGTAGLLTSVLSIDQSANVIRARIAGIALTTIDWTAYMDIRSTEL